VGNAKSLPKRIVRAGYVEPKRGDDLGRVAEQRSRGNDNQGLSGIRQARLTPAKRAHGVAGLDRRTGVRANQTARPQLEQAAVAQASLPAARIQWLASVPQHVRNQTLPPIGGDLNQVLLAVSNVDGQFEHGVSPGER
jgi:hypothetical protein